MTKERVCERIREIGLLPAIRVTSSADADFAADTVIQGGIPIVEITMTCPGALDVISRLAHDGTETIVGAGTVLDAATAKRCVDAGAHFITAPELNQEVVQFTVKANVAVLPGALTPTEVTAAWRAGADFVKVFPCAAVGGDSYVKALHVTLPQIPIIAAGGVNQQTATGFLLAGAVAIGVGRELVPHEAIEHRQADRIRELARRFVGFVHAAREGVEGAAPVHQRRAKHHA